METENKSNFGVPIAIIIAGFLIAGAVYFGDSQKVVTKPEPVVQKGLSASLDQVRPISTTDHIRGNPNAQVIVVEYSDTECPFCGRFHETMKQIITEYGKDGRVAWVYRHLPLIQIHPKASTEALALECAGELGGNDKFWAYTDRIYEITPANNGLDLAELPKIASFVGLDPSAFNACLTSGRNKNKIDADSANAQATGGNGTPWSIVVLRKAISSEQEKAITDYINQNGLQDNVSISTSKLNLALSGALPLAMVKTFIDILLK